MIFYAGIWIVSSTMFTSVLGLNPDLCPPKWQPWNGACYRLTEYESGETWVDTRAACRAMGGQLAAPGSPQESLFFASLAKEAGLTYLWIACTNTDTEGKWVCEGQGTSEEFFDWNTSPAGTGQCAYIISQGPLYLGKWYDYPCSIRFRGVCVIRTPSQPSSSRSCYHRFAIATSPDPPNSCLLEHIITEFVITSIPSCASACIKEPRCRSINIRTTEGGEDKVCELNNSTRFDDPNNFQNPIVGCVHYSLDP